MGKLGITRSYVMLNALLYSVYGSNGMKYVAKPKVAAYRNQWIEAILASDSVEAVITFGNMAKKAWNESKEDADGCHLDHPREIRGVLSVEFPAPTPILPRQVAETQSHHNA